MNQEYPQVYELGLGSLIGDFFQNVKDTVTGVAKAVAPIAPYVLPFIPGGPLVQLGLGAGIGLASGQKPADVAKNLAIQTALTGLTGGFSKAAGTKSAIDTGTAAIGGGKDYPFLSDLGGASKGIQTVSDKPGFFQKIGGATKDFFTEGLGARLNPFSEASKYKMNPNYAAFTEAQIKDIMYNPEKNLDLIKVLGMPMIERGIAGQIGPSFLAASTFLPFVLPNKQQDNYPSAYDLYMQNPDQYIVYSADGGPITGYAAGSGQKIEHPNGKVMEHPKRIGEIAGKGTGTSDDIPAMLSDGEFVMTAQAVRNAGGGSRKEGAKNMYKLMKNLENGGSLSRQSMGMIGRN